MRAQVTVGVGDGIAANRVDSDGDTDPDTDKDFRLLVGRGGIQT